MKYKILVIFIVIFGHLSVSSFITQLPPELKLSKSLADDDDDDDDDREAGQIRRVNVSTPRIVSPEALPTTTTQNPMLMKATEKIEVTEREMNSVEKLNQFTQADNIQNLIKQNVISNPDLGTNLQNLDLKNTVQQGKEILEGTGLKTENLFGIFKVQIPVSVQIDPKTGEVITTNKSFWNIILDYLSF